jgi:ABC-type nitrate/sulfonate/bicarbonate transport system substrate-binding protein
MTHTEIAFANLFDAVLKGSDSVAIVGGLANPIYSLIARPDIKSYADLNGRTVGLSRTIDTISIASQMLLAKHGIKEPAVHLKEIDGTPARAACLTKGECDAVPLGQPDDILFRQKGYTKLGDSLEVIPLLQFNVIAARRAWAAANKDKVARFARAFGNAYRFIADKANRVEVVNTIVETTGAPADVARTILEFYYQPGRSVMPKQAEINMAGLTAVINLVGGTGALKPPLPSAERFVDLQYLKAAGLQ